MIKTTAVTIVVMLFILVAAVLAYAATKPDSFHIQRTTNIKAPPEKIFALINDFHRWEAWSPYEKLDPAMKKAHSGSASGKGAIYSWDGNRNAGKGSVEITDVVPSSKIAMKLDMVSPFEAHNIVEFTLDAKGTSTNVTWAMHGPQPYMAKVVGTVIDCDKMVGGQFDEGLASLKTLAER